MKSNPKIKVIISITIGILLALSLLINNDLSFNVENRYKSTEYSDGIILDNENVSLSKISGPIYINDYSPSDNWSVAKGAGICTGNGTYSEPYIIEDFVIDGGGSGDGILIENSDVYFRIENCTIYNAYSGIKLNYTNNGTLFENNCSNNEHGIHLENCKDNFISGNTVHNNFQTGISIPSCINIKVSENNVNSNQLLGIALMGSDHNSILNNSVSYSGADGISMGTCDYNNISGNTLDNNPFGIYIDEGRYNLILGNIINNGNYGMDLRNLNDTIISKNSVKTHERGIYILENCNNNNISRNSISDNDYGIFLDTSENNKIFHNTIEGNLVDNAYDDGTNNQWDNGTIGNYWDDYSGKDSNDDGIGDTPYNISGDAGSQDNYPTWWDPPVISIHSPLENQAFGSTPPNFNISIVEGIVDTIWYTVDGGITNFTCSTIDIVNQTIWDGLDYGNITITFFANDSRNYIAMVSVIIRKRSPSEPIPGYNLFVLLGILSVVLILVLKKLKKS